MERSGGAAQGGWPPEVVRAVPRLARRIALRAPAWLRDEVVAAAAMAMWEAWASGEVASIAGLRVVGRKAAGRASRSVAYGCGEWSAYRVAERLSVPERLGADVLDGGAWESLAHRPPNPLGGGSEARLGPLLARVVGLLVVEGMDGALAERAVEVVADLTADVGVHAVYNEATSELVARTGLDPRSCRALVVLVVGQPRARNGGPHPGLLERAVRGGDEVWDDPRVAVLVSEVVRPSRAYVRGAWSPSRAVASAAVPTPSSADETRRSTP